MNAKVYKWCVVPQCHNTSKKTPNKLFVYVPNNKTMRYKWLNLAWRDPLPISNNSPIYFCEDHFDLPNDMENYMQYHVMGSVSQVRMKSGCVPSKFECQSDIRKRISNNTAQGPYIPKKQRKILIEKCEEDLGGSITTKHLKNKKINAAETSANTEDHRVVVIDNNEFVSRLPSPETYTNISYEESEVPPKSIPTANGASKNDDTMVAPAAEEMLVVNDFVEYEPNTKKRGRKKCTSGLTTKDFSSPSKVMKNFIALKNTIDMQWTTIDILQNKVSWLEGKIETLNEKLSIQESSDNTTRQRHNSSNKQSTEYNGLTNDSDHNIPEIDVKLLIPKVEIEDVSTSVGEYIDIKPFAEAGDNLTQSFS